MYVRFTVQRPNTHSGFAEGVFVAVYRLSLQDELEDWEEEWYERELAWFNKHLKVPDDLCDWQNRRALCWFRPAATQPIARIRSLVALLEHRSIPVTMSTTRDPGIVIYEDDWQVCAKPRHRRTGKRAHRQLLAAGRASIT